MDLSLGELINFFFDTLNICFLNCFQVFIESVFVFFLSHNRSRVGLASS